MPSQNLKKTFLAGGSEDVPAGDFRDLDGPHSTGFEQHSESIATGHGLNQNTRLARAILISPVAPLDATTWPFF